MLLSVRMLDHFLNHGFHEAPCHCMLATVLDKIKHFHALPSLGCHDRITIHLHFHSCWLGALNLLLITSLKRKYRHTPSYSINDMVKVVQSSTVAGRNTIQLTKDVNGKGMLC